MYYIVHNNREFFENTYDTALFDNLQNTAFCNLKMSYVFRL